MDKSNCKTAEVISPRQLAKQKRELIEQAKMTGGGNRNCYVMGLKILHFDQLYLGAIFKNTGPKKNANGPYRFVKYECVCGEIGYENCPLEGTLLLYHVFSSLGEFYTVVAKFSYLPNRGVANHLFVCNLCRTIMQLPTISLDDVLFHIKEHFIHLPTNARFYPIPAIFKPRSLDGSINFNVLNLFTNEYVAPIDGDIIKNANDYRIPEEIKEKAENQTHIIQYLRLECVCCMHIYNSRSMWEILSHARECFGSYLKNLPKIYTGEEGIKKYLYD